LSHPNILPFLGINVGTLFRGRSCLVGRWCVGGDVVGYLWGWVGERRRRAKGKGKMQETGGKKEHGEEDEEKEGEDDLNVLRRVDAVSRFLSPPCSCVLK
jgi:hypothetical protein